MVGYLQVSAISTSQTKSVSEASISAEQFKTHQGALAQYAAVPAVNLVHRPPNLSEVQAAGVTLTSMTALLALDEAKLEEGQTLFVNGGSTAVGSFAIQLAKLRGARVVASASKKNESFVRSLGADEVCFGCTRSIQTSALKFLALVH